MLTSKQKVKQLESESEHLLSEYRYQRDRADHLEQQNRQLNARISQVEQRLAETGGSMESRMYADRSAANPPTSPVPPAGDAQQRWRPSLR